ncbi:MAG: metal-dependent hydrolase [Pseudomonadales bacterium]
MDPITQGAFGAAAAQSSAQPGRVGIAMLAGWLAGMAADLDVLIRSSADPLMFLEYHRHFTHSLIFIPVGGLIVAAFVFFAFGKRRQWPFRNLLLYCTLGYATHGLLDSCTSYGTLLLWPFSDKRYAWDTISIIDPLLTVPVLVLLFVSLRKQSPWPARAALSWSIAYLCIGWWQHERALNTATALAESRGHKPVRLEVKPGFANLLLFKSIYSTGDRFYVDAVRVGVDTQWITGDSIAKLNPDRDLPWLQQDSQQRKDLQRFTWFSDGYVALHPNNPNEVIDIRYSMLPNEVEPLWGIELDQNAGASEFAKYRTHRDDPESRLSEYWKMLRDR